MEFVILILINLIFIGIIWTVNDDRKEFEKFKDVVLEELDQQRKILGELTGDDWLTRN